MSFQHNELLRRATEAFEGSNMGTTATPPAEFVQAFVFADALHELSARVAALEQKVSELDKRP